jgi:hypothetical protein
VFSVVVFMFAVSCLGPRPDELVESANQAAPLAAALPGANPSADTDEPLSTSTETSIDESAPSLGPRESTSATPRNLINSPTPEEVRSPTAVPNLTGNPSPTPTFSPTATITPTPAPTETAISTPEPDDTATPTLTQMPTLTPTKTPIPTPEPDDTATPTSTPVPSPATTPTPTLTETPTPIPLPNLKPFVLKDWADPLIVSSTVTPFLDMPPSRQIEFVVGDQLYLNWAVINDSEVDVDAPFMIGILVNGENLLNFVVPKLPAREIASDLNLVMDLRDTLESRVRDVSLVVDLGQDIAESDEGDNTFVLRGFWNTPTPSPTSTPIPPPTFTPPPPPIPTSTPTPGPTPFVSQSVTTTAVQPGEIVTVSVAPHDIAHFYAVSVDLGGLAIVDHTADGYVSGVFILLEAKPFTYKVKIPQCASVGQTFPLTAKWWVDPDDKRDINAGQTNLTWMSQMG